MALWAYHWSTEETYYTPIDAPTVGEAIKKIEDAWKGKRLNGHIWGVDEKTKFKVPANEWITICFAVLHEDYRDYARYHPSYYEKTLNWNERNEGIMSVTS